MEKFMTRYWFTFLSAYTATRYDIDKDMLQTDAMQLYHVLASGFTDVKVRYLAETNNPRKPYEWRALNWEGL